MQNEIMKAVIEVTVDEILEDIKKEPDVAIVKLINKLEEFINNKFNYQLPAIIKQNLVNKEGYYFQCLKNIATTVNSNKIKKWILNLIFNNMKYYNEGINNFSLDIMKINYYSSSSFEQIFKKSYNNNIYIYIINLESSNLLEIKQLIKQYSDCLFIIFVNDSINDDIINNVLNADNIYTFLKTNSSGFFENLDILINRGYLCGSYSYYSENFNEEKLCKNLNILNKHQCLCYALFNQPQLDSDIINEVSSVVSALRKSSKYTMLLVNFNQDILKILKIFKDRIKIIDN